MLNIYHVQVRYCDVSGWEDLRREYSLYDALNVRRTALTNYPYPVRIVCKPVGSEQFSDENLAVIETHCQDAEIEYLATNCRL